MSDETKKQTADAEVNDEDLAQVAGGGPHVKVFDGRTGAEMKNEPSLAHEAVHTIQGGNETRSAEVEVTLTVTDTLTN